MKLACYRIREIGKLRRLSLDPFLCRLTCLRKERHLVVGDDFAHPDVESVPGVAVKFSEDFLYCNLVVLSDEDGCISLYNTSAPAEKALIKKQSLHKSAIFDVEWVPGARRIITASGDQTSFLWDIQTGQVIDVFRGHTASLKSIASRKTDPFVFATGGRDGCICIWDSRVARRNDTIPTANDIRNAHSVNRTRRLSTVSQSITGLVFQEETTLISAASNDGAVKVWDMRRSYKTMKTEPMPKYMFTYHGKSNKQGYSGISMDHAKSCIFVNCTDDVIYQFNCISYKDEVVAQYHGHKNKTFFVKSCVSADDSYLLSGSSDSNAYIWKIGEPEPLVKLIGHTDEVTSTSWNHFDHNQIATVGDDDTLRIWRLDVNSGHDDEIDGFAEAQFNGTTNIRNRHNLMTCNTHSKPPVPALPLTGTDVFPWPKVTDFTIQPRFNSPKKLLVSPRKPCLTQYTPGFDGKGVKRRLSNSVDFQDGPLAKQPYHTALDRAVVKHKQQTLSPIRIQNSPSTIINVTPSSSRHVNFCELASPTANLPNSVMDPQLTPSRHDKENSLDSHTPEDWLTKYRQERLQQMNKSPRFDGNITPSTRTPSQTPRSHSVSKTPCNVRQTLLNYFSPKSSKILEDEALNASHDL